MTAAVPPQPVLGMTEEANTPVGEGMAAHRRSGVRQVPSIWEVRRHCQMGRPAAAVAGGPQGQQFHVSHNCVFPSSRATPAAAVTASPAVFSYTPAPSAAGAASVPYVTDDHSGRRVHVSPAAALGRYPGMAAGPGMAVVAEPVVTGPEDALGLDLQLSLAPAGL